MVRAIALSREAPAGLQMGRNEPEKNEGEDMRTLSVDELDQVSGGALPLVAAAVKYAAPAIAAIAAVTYGTIKALESAKELCKEGADAQVKSKLVDMSCSGVKKPEVRLPSRPVDPNDRNGMLKANVPDAVFG